MTSPAVIRWVVLFVTLLCLHSTIAGTTGRGFSVVSFQSQGYLIDSRMNPRLNLEVGVTHAFIVNAPGHPFWIKTAETLGTSDGVVGVERNGLADGTVVWTTTPAHENRLFYYICQYHANMVGEIYVYPTGQIPPPAVVPPSEIHVPPPHVLITPTMSTYVPTFDPTVPSPPTVHTPPKYGSNSIDLDREGFIFKQELFSGLTVYWKPSNATHVTIALRGVTRGYIAIGWNEEFRMIGGDAIIAAVDDVTGETLFRQVVLTAKNAETFAYSPIELFNLYGEQVGRTTTVIFTRTLESGIHGISPNGTTVMYGSMGTTDRLAFHGSDHSSRGFAANYKDGRVKPVTARPWGLIDVHGLIMLASFGFILPVGVALARYLRYLPNKSLWFQIIGVLGAIAGFVLIIVVVDSENNGYHFATAFHGQIGVAVMALALIQGIFGLVHPDPENKGMVRTIFEWVHPWLGRFIVFGVVAQIIFGMIEAKWIDNYPYIFWIYVSLGVIALFAIGFLEYRRWRLKKEGKQVGHFMEMQGDTRLEPLVDKKRDKERAEAKEKAAPFNEPKKGADANTAWL